MNIKRAVFSGMAITVAFALSGCTAMMTLPNDKLSEAAAATTGKQITAVTNVRSVGDVQSFDAVASDGKTYACSLSVVMGVTYQHQKCALK
jgi:hypothetical protein